jgi:hypothetical protein
MFSNGLIVGRPARSRSHLAFKLLLPSQQIEQDQQLPEQDDSAAGQGALTFVRRNSSPSEWQMCE